MPDPDTPTPPARARDEVDEATRLMTVVRAGLRGLTRAQLPRMAAALAYRTIFSIIPVLAIVLVVVSGFVSPVQVREGLSSLLEYSGLETISVSVEDTAPAQPEPQMGPAPEGAAAIPEPVSGLLDDEQGQTDADAPEEGEVQALDELITGLVERVTSSLGAINRGWIGFISAGIFIYAALSLLLEIERAFNAITRATRGRRWFDRVVLYWTMLTLGSAALLATFAVGQRFTAWVQALLGGDSASGWQLGLAAYGVTVLISTAMLLVAYRIIPAARVSTRSALAGAFLAAVAWELGKLGFTRYLEFSAGYARFYGSLALLPLFMLWVYVTWVIVLFGLQVAYAMDHFGEFSADEDDRPAAILDPAHSIGIAIVVARAFEDGRTVSVERVAAELEIDAPAAARLAGALVEAGLLRSTDDDSQGSELTLARPASRIEASAVLDAGLTRAAPDRTGALGAIDASRRAAVEGRTISDLMEK